VKGWFKRIEHFGGTGSKEKGEDDLHLFHHSAAGLPARIKHGEKIEARHIPFSSGGCGPSSYLSLLSMSANRGQTPQGGTDVGNATTNLRGKGRGG